MAGGNEQPLMPSGDLEPGAASKTSQPSAEQDQRPVEVARTNNGSQPRLDLKAVWQLASMSLGIGVFAFPAVFQALGPLQATIWVIILGCFANFAIQRLLDVAATESITSYEELVARAFGFGGEVSMTILTLVTTFIACLSYIGAARDLLVHVAVAFIVDIDVNKEANGVEVFSQTKNNVVLVLLVLVAMPMLLSPNIGDNTWISTVGVTSMVLSSVFFVCTCVVLLSDKCSGARCGDKPNLVAGSVVDVLQYTATLAFSYSMIFAAFPVMKERIVDDNIAAAVARVKPAVAVSVSFLCAIYIVVGVVGVNTFGNASKPVALSNLALSQPLTQAISFLVCVSSTLLVAIVGYPTVCSLERIGSFMRSRSADSGRRSCAAARPWLVVALGIAIVVVDSGLPTKIAFALCGSLGLATCAYVMPCLVFLKLGDAGPTRWYRLAAVVILLFGCAMLLGSTPVTIWRLLHNSDDSKPPEPLKNLLCPRENFV